MSYVRTPEHRRRRAELIRRWKPWEKSTGPRTPQGKASSSMNAWKGGPRAGYEILRALRRREPNSLIVEVLDAFERARAQLGRPSRMRPVRRMTP